MTEVVFPESSMEGDSICAYIVIIDDDALECSQDFTVAIGSTTLGTATGPQSQAVVTIVDNDSKCDSKYLYPVNPWPLSESQMVPTHPLALTNVTAQNSQTWQLKNFRHITWPTGVSIHDKTSKLVNCTATMTYIKFL